MKLRSKKEINEYLAEHLFGLKKDVDFGKLPYPCAMRKKEIEEGARCNSLSCPSCTFQAIFEEKGKLFCNNPSDNYISRFQLVLEKLLILTDCAEQNLQIEYCQENQEFFVYIIQPFNEIEPILCKGESKNLGEAVCFAAVEYLQGR